MFNTITKHSFQDAFHKMGRGDEFSYGGLLALYDWFEEYEDSAGSQIELDVIAICYEYAEYDSLKDFQDDYGDEYKSLENIQNRTTLIKIEGTERFIIDQF